MLIVVAEDQVIEVVGEMCCLADKVHAQGGVGSLGSYMQGCDTQDCPCEETVIYEQSHAKW
jgi:hypothetical protein